MLIHLPEVAEQRYSGTNGRSRRYVNELSHHSEFRWLIPPTGTATVREAMRFSAYLRQPASISKEEKDEYVEEMIELLELQDLTEALVMTLSVEARKRLTIGVELASKPELLLFLDEPTSGLDAQRYVMASCNVVFLLTLAVHIARGILFVSSANWPIKGKPSFAQSTNRRPCCLKASTDSYSWSVVAKPFISEILVGTLMLSEATSLVMALSVLPT